MSVFQTYINYLLTRQKTDIFTFQFYHLMNPGHLSWAFVHQANEQYINIVYTVHVQSTVYSAVTYYTILEPKILGNLNINFN